MITKDKNYFYVNGQQAKIISLDHLYIKYPILSQAPDGKTYHHDLEGRCINTSDYDIILDEVKEVEVVKKDESSVFSKDDHVLVSNDGEFWMRRHFCSMGPDGSFLTYGYGYSSFTFNGVIHSWKHCKAA